MCCGSGGYCLGGDSSEEKTSFKDIMRASPCIVSGGSRLSCESTSARTFPLTKTKCLRADQPLIATGRRFTALQEAKAGCEFERCIKQCGAKGKKKKGSMEHFVCPVTLDVARAKTLIPSRHKKSCLTSRPSQDEEREVKSRCYNIMQKFQLLFPNSHPTFIHRQGSGALGQIFFSKSRVKETEIQKPV